MHDLNILCVGVIRNGEHCIRQAIDTISKAFGFSSSLHWFLVESDSEDQTRNILEELAAGVPNFSYASMGDLRHDVPLRTQRIAICRNRYLDEIENNPKFQPVDYAVIADLDGVNHGLDEWAARSCWSVTGWDACFANQVGAYYDIWALRHALWSPNDCWEQVKFLKARGVNPDHALYASVISRMIEIPTTADWIEVDSAFGGLGVYKKEILRGIRHEGVTATGGEVCEWVDFHRALRARGHRLFINPQLINGGYNEHSFRFKALLEQSRRRPHA